jgi:hypothetical protein
VLRIVSFFVCWATVAAVSFDAQAFPYLPASAQVVARDAIQVRGFCGLGRHRGPFGGCVPNGVPYGYAAPVVVVAPHVVVAPRVTCPYPYHYDPDYGGCLR